MDNSVKLSTLFLTNIMEAGIDRVVIRPGDRRPIKISFGFLIDVRYFAVWSSAKSGTGALGTYF